MVFLWIRPHSQARGKRLIWVWMKLYSHNFKWLPKSVPQHSLCAAGNARLLAEARWTELPKISSLECSLGLLCQPWKHGKAPDSTVLPKHWARTQVIKLLCRATNGSDGAVRTHLTGAAAALGRVYFSSCEWWMWNYSARRQRKQWKLWGNRVFSAQT